MKTNLMIATALLLVSGLAQAKTTLQCEKQVEAAISQWDNSVTVVSVKSKDGKTYYAAYYEDGGDAEDQALLQVDVNPENCAVLKIQDAQ